MGYSAAFLWLHTHSDPLEKRRCRLDLEGKLDTQVCYNYKNVTLVFIPGLVLTRFLVDRVCQKLLTHQRYEQSGFTPKRATLCRILALLVLTERLRDIRTG